MSTSSRLLIDLLLYNDWWLIVQYSDVSCVSLHTDIGVNYECCGLLILGTLGYVNEPIVAVVG